MDLIWIWIWLDSDLDLDLDLILILASVWVWLDFDSIWVGFWSIRALVALISFLGGPRKLPGLIVEAP